MQKHPNARVFSFGIGSSVNRFLLDKMADEGRGEVEYVGLNDDGSAAARRFHERVRNPAADRYLGRLGRAGGHGRLSRAHPRPVQRQAGDPDGRYERPGRGGDSPARQDAGRPMVREIAVNLPAVEPEHDVLATLWARARIDDLMGQDYSASSAAPRARTCARRSRNSGWSIG